jgi:uncharacterized membrane protein YeaQ/YmgE (transglycosylase-associated protein family)
LFLNSKCKSTLFLSSKKFAPIILKIASQCVFSRLINFKIMIWTLIIGGVAGWLAGRIMRGDGFGVIIDIIVGLIGGWLGGMVLGWLGIASGGSLIGRLIVALIGSIILIWIIRLIRR